MKTEQEHLYKMINMLEKLEKGDYCLDNCYGCCGDGKIGITCPNVVSNFIQALTEAGYGDVSEYKAEIERLKTANSELMDNLVFYKDKSYKLERSVDKLKTEIEQEVKQAQIDVLNKLKKKTHNYYPSIDSYCMSQHVVLVRDIDELIKEAEKQ